MLSKMAKPAEEPKNTYKDISKIDLTKSKLPELKQFARDLNIRVSGNKGELKQRIEDQVKKEQSSITIQKTFRRRLVFKWIKLKENHRSDLVGKILDYEYGK